MVFSNAEQKKLAKSWIESETIPGNILLSGPAGTGKSTLARILIKKIIKNQADLLRVKSRSVRSVDDQVVPFVTKKPASSKIKIVFIEELDRTSRQFQGELKEDLLEMYQEYVSFIACTNYPRRIDGALRTRFNLPIDFKSDNIEDIKKRLEYILNQKNVKFSPSDLAEFVNKNYKAGLRNLINGLQKSFISNNAVIDFENLQQNLNIEDNITSYIIQMIEMIMASPDINAKKTCLSTPFSSMITKEYSSFVTLCHNNYDINYENIFERLYETIKYLPMQIIIGKYSEEIDLKKYPHLHLIACFYEIMKCGIESTM